MKHRIAFLLLPVIISLSLLASFLITAPVFAQDELPPEAPVPTEIIPVVEENPIVEPVPPEVAPPEEAVPVEEAPVEEPALDTPISEEGAVEVPFEQNPAEDLSPALEALADAGLVLADENGEPLSLAAEEAVEFVTNSDPLLQSRYCVYRVVSWSYLPCASLTCQLPHISRQSIDRCG